VSEPAKVFEDRQWRGDWRVEWMDDDGGARLLSFSGPNARERAIRYADRQVWQFGGGQPFTLPVIAVVLSTSPALGIHPSRRRGGR
jgi:hypothetical protein